MPLGRHRVYSKYKDEALNILCSFEVVFDIHLGKAPGAALQRRGAAGVLLGESTRLGTLSRQVAASKVLHTSYWKPKSRKYMF